MTAKNIRNVSDVPLSIPNGVTIAPQRETRIDNWEHLQNDDTMRSWVRAGAIEISDAAPRSTKETGPSEEEAERSLVDAERKSAREEVRVSQAVRDDLTSKTKK